MTQDGRFPRRYNSNGRNSGPEDAFHTSPLLDFRIPRNVPLPVELGPAEGYGNALRRAGFDEREAARGYLFAREFGVDALSPPTELPNACVSFAEPKCGSWDCLAPRHQTLEYSVNRNWN